MLRTCSLAAMVVLTAVTVWSGCGSSDPEPGDSGKGGSDNGGSAGQGGTDGGEAGTGGSRGGRGGSAGRGGTSGQGGSSGEAGSSGSSGTAGDGGGDTGGSGGGGEPECTAADDQCPAGQYCGPDDECVPGCKLDDDQCPAGQYCGPDNQCVPGCKLDDDQCPAGQYCAPDHECLPGCRNDAACASGNCTETHDCDVCVKDSECAEGRVCGNGQCHEPCSPSDPKSCSADLDCCDGHCAETDYDIAHCMACGMACDADEFCGTEGCALTTFANVCKIRSVVVIIDEQPGDLAPARALGAALAATCMPTPPVTEMPEAMATVINPATGQPLGGGDLIAAAGGYVFQNVVDFLEGTSTGRTAPVYAASAGGMYELRRSDTGATLISFPPSMSNSAHDYLAIYVARDLTTGVPALVAYGFHQSGTAAAAWYFSNVILPGIATETHSWYTFEWTDDGDSMPDAGDMFELIASGP